MRFLEFRLTGFAQHHETLLRFASDTPSMIVGPNESGKSHLLSALIGTLFGMAEADWKKNVPWDGDPSMCGELRFEADGQQITLLRRFSENQVDVIVDGNSIYHGRGLTARKTAEDEQYQRMLARWLGFTEMEIFRDVVFVEQDQLHDDRLAKRAPEIKRLISGSHEASYETALTDLNADLDKLKRLPRKRNDREIELLENELEKLRQRVAEAEQAETRAVDLLEAEQAARGELAEIGAQRSTLAALLETFGRSHVLRTRLDQQTREYNQANAAWTTASASTGRRASLAAAAAELRVPGDPDPSNVRAAQFEHSNAIAACRKLDAEIEQYTARIKRLRMASPAAAPSHARTQPRFELLIAGVVVTLLSLLLAVTVEPRALTGLPIAGMLFIAAFLFPRTVRDEAAPDVHDVDLRVAEQQLAQLTGEMESARQCLEEISARGATWLIAANEPSLDALIARLDRLHETSIRLAETEAVSQSDIERLRAASNDALTQLAITNREIEQLQADHPELLTLTAEDSARHQQALQRFDVREASLKETLNGINVDRQVLARLTVDDAAALRIDIREKEAEIERKRRLAAALELAIDTMTSCVRDFQEHALDPVGGEAGRLLQQITAGRHAGVEIDQQTMEPTVTTHGRSVGVDALSRGTRDQLYLAVRVALVDALSGGIQLPLIFDDPCVHFDAGRLGATAQLLREIAHERQVIILTKDESFTHWFEPVLRLQLEDPVLPSGVAL
jgi:DNA repair exonuclease SbcCD ATPase subunit